MRSDTEIPVTGSDGQNCPAQVEPEPTAQICAVQHEPPEALQEPLKVEPVLQCAKLEKAAQNAIQEHYSTSESFTLEESARLYLRGCKLEESDFMISNVMKSRNAGNLSDELFYKFIELGKAL